MGFSLVAGLELLVGVASLVGDGPSGEWASVAAAPGSKAQLK